MKTMYSITMYARNGNYRKFDTIYSEPESAICAADRLLRDHTLHRVCVFAETDKMSTQIWALTSLPIFNEEGALP